MATNQYLAFGTAGGANVMTPTAYAALAARGSGFQAGLAASIQANTPWRQTSVAAAAIAQFVCDTTAVDMNDDGSVANYESKFIAALNAEIGLVISGGAYPVREAKVSVSIVAGVVNFDFSLGNTFVVAITANITSITFSNFPPSGKVQGITVIWVGNGTTFTVSGGLGSSILKWLGAAGPGTAPTFYFGAGVENLTTFIARDGITTRVNAVFDGTAAA